MLSLRTENDSWGWGGQKTKTKQNINVSKSGQPENKVGTVDWTGADGSQEGDWHAWRPHQSGYRSIPGQECITAPNAHTHLGFLKAGATRTYSEEKHHALSTLGAQEVCIAPEL